MRTRKNWGTNDRMCFDCAAKKRYRPEQAVAFLFWVRAKCIACGTSKATLHMRVWKLDGEPIPYKQVTK